LKIGIYLRVSKEEQTLEQQAEPCANRCTSEGWEYKFYTDKASGARETRPQLDIMMQDMRNGEIDAIMVYKLDRLGRNLKHLLQIISELRNREVQFISISEGFDTNTPMGRFGLAIMGAMAQMEREMISERTKRKLDYLKSKGKRLGRPPGAKDKRPRRKAGYILAAARRKQGEDNKKGVYKSVEEYIDNRPPNYDRKNPL